MRIGVVGYGTGGKNFHVPFIQAARGVELAGVVARAPETIARVRDDLPDIPVYPSLGSMIESGGVDAVTITTPPHTRRDLVLEAINAGVHVVADKPFAPSAEAGRDLDRAARNRGVVLGVFHNRRWDTDVVTLKKVLESQRLGKIWRVHSRMEQDDPGTIEPGPTGGLLRDLGSHMVDQMLWLLGPAVRVSAQLDMVMMKEGETDAGFVMTILHASGAHSHLSASKMNRLAVKQFRAYGERGSFVSSGTDVQADAIFAGRRPAENLEAWGYESPELWGMLRTSDGEVRVPSEQGRYHDYYEAFAHAVATNGMPPVTATDAIETLTVLDSARASAIEGRTVNV